jgi:hypothetical protein
MPGGKEFEQAFDEAAFGASREGLSRMSDIQLASWQSGYKPGTAQYIVADHEWQSRRIARQVRGAYISAAVGLVGVVVGWALRSLP